jgi:hypothetical protein
MCANSSLTRAFEASMAPLLRSAAVPKNTCPSMSLRDYALLSGNRYTVMFSRRAHETAPVTALSSMPAHDSDPWRYLYTATFLIYAVHHGWKQLGEADYQTALAELKRTSNLVLFSETLTQQRNLSSRMSTHSHASFSGLRCGLSGFAQLSSFLGERLCPQQSQVSTCCEQNVHTHTQVLPTATDMRHVERTLAWDIRLYRELRTYWEAWS